MILGKVENLEISSMPICLDVHCDNLGALPLEASTALRLLLPYKLNNNQTDFNKDYLFKDLKEKYGNIPM